MVSGEQSGAIAIEFNLFVSGWIKHAAQPLDTYSVKKTKLLHSMSPLVFLSGCGNLAQIR